MPWWMPATMFLGMAARSPILSQVRPDGLEDAPQIRMDIDRDKANALGVGFDSINTALSTAMGSAYVNDFPNRGRMQRVVVQADAQSRMQPADLLKITAPNSQGEAVPLSAFATVRWVMGAQQTVRYNGYPAMKHFRRCLQRAIALAKPWPRWSAWLRSCLTASALNGPASRVKKS